MTAERLRKTASPMHDVSALSHSGVWDGPYKGSEKNHNRHAIKLFPRNMEVKESLGKKRGDCASSEKTREKAVCDRG